MSGEKLSFAEPQSTGPDGSSDADLLASLRLEKQESFRILYDRYAAVVMGATLRIVGDRAAAEAIVEEVFFDLWEHPDRGGGSLANRLVWRARTLAIQRRRSHAPPLDLSAADAPPAEPGDSFAETPDLRWKRERTRAALLRVPDNARQVVEMACLNAWGMDEIARRLHLSPGVVRQLFSSGMRALQDALRTTITAANPFNSANFPLVSIDRVRVLIVDDEPDARRMLTFVLETVGALVTVAASVAEAVTVLPQANPDVLLSDLAMPEEDGFDLIRKVRRTGRTARDLPAIALTAFVTKQVRRDVMRAGFQMHVAKPVDPHELAEVVASLAGRTGTI